MTMIKIPVTKAKGQVIEINTDELGDNVYEEVIKLGLKALVNRGTSKITKETYPKAEELAIAAMAQAEKQLQAIYAGNIRVSSSAPKEASGAVMVEARRLAKNLVKDELKRKGKRVSHYEAADITKMANALIEARPDLVAQATANIEERSKQAVPIDVGAIKPSDKKIKAAEAAKAKKAEQAKAPGASAAKAGKTEKRAGQPKKAPPKTKSEPTIHHAAQ